MLRRTEIEEFFHELQDEICNGMEKLDDKSKFKEDLWVRPEGGGGITRVIGNGNVIEKGGVNFSAVLGKCPDFLKKELELSLSDELSFFATGVSIVIHPLNPFVPIIHMNVRYFEAGHLSWFGGGIDLTPHYVFEEDVRFFHTHLKKMCNSHNPSYYPEFKTWADNYFYITHRNETRGIGGIFFDRLEATNDISIEQRFAFVIDTGKSFLNMYVPLAIKNKDKKYTEQNRNWQLLRRGRYAEFNLVYDRGTKFGLFSNGRTESILMSLPPLARWEYDVQLSPESAEAQTISLLKKGINWAV
jgi:coproporphyrinogen III oxidase